jgi:hypothetical protein
LADTGTGAFSGPLGLGGVLLLLAGGSILVLTRTRTRRPGQHQ